MPSHDSTRLTTSSTHATSQRMVLKSRLRTRTHSRRSLSELTQSSMSFSSSCLTRTTPTRTFRFFCRLPTSSRAPSYATLIRISTWTSSLPRLSPLATVKRSPLLICSPRMASGRPNSASMLGRSRFLSARWAAGAKATPSSNCLDAPSWVTSPFQAHLKSTRSSRKNKTTSSSGSRSISH